MQILIYSGRRTVPSLNVSYPFVSLFQDNWDDYNWRCRFLATLHLSEDEEVKLGAMRIAVNNAGFRAKTLPTVIDKLPPQSASLGESIAYYRAIGRLKPTARRKYLDLMRDIVARPTRRNRIESEDLWEKSFMREASSRHALSRGGFYIGSRFAEAEPLKFRLTMTVPDATGPHVVDIDFSRHNGLPHRTVLFIGRNGTGKTTALAALAASLMPSRLFRKSTIAELPNATVAPDIALSRLIAISYNAFDEFPLPRPPSEKAPRIDGVEYRSRGSYKYCGLRNSDGMVTTSEVREMLDQTLAPVIDSDRVDILRDLLSTLLNPDMATILTADDVSERSTIIRGLSAGQRLLVAIVSNIVGFIEEGSLLLIDEPETNLHPGLLSSLVTALNKTLVEFDSYAIVASHSPILLQQVPGRFVRHFTRDSINRPRVRSLEIESFGEDLGELTRRVLGLADPEKDFTDTLRTLFDEHGSAQEVEALFDYPLGIPATAYLYALEDEASEMDGKS